MATTNKNNQLAKNMSNMSAAEEIKELNKEIKIYTTAVAQDLKNPKHLGLVTASLVVSRNMFSTMGSGFKSLVGGRLKGQIKLMQNYRAQLIQELTEKALSMGANAIVGLRIDVDDVQGFTSFFGYATAMKSQ